MMNFQILDVLQADSGLYSCQLVGEAVEEQREEKKQKEETREELQINVFPRETEVEEEENWKVFQVEKQELSRRTEGEGGGIEEKEAGAIRESERGGQGSDGGRSRHIFQKFQSSHLLKVNSGDVQKEVEIRTGSNLTNPFLATKSMRNVTEPSLSADSRTVLLSNVVVAEDDLSNRPTLLLSTSVASLSGGKMQFCKHCVLVFLCFLLKT